MAADGTLAIGRPGPDDVRKRRTRSATETVVYGFLFFAFAEVAIHLLTLAAGHQSAVTLAVSEPVATSFSRPDIVDRNGRLLATDLEAGYRSERASAGAFRSFAPFRVGAPGRVAKNRAARARSRTSRAFLPL